jgi:DNA-binding GntR family transcriptional regulator
MVLTDPDVSGTFINEQQIATEVGVSRTPVREALLMLAAEDLVQLLPNRGAFVAPVRAREIGEVMQARGLIERWAAATCLADGHPPVAEMTAVLDRQRAIAADGDAREFIDLDRQFHELLVAAAGNSVLARLYEMLRDRHVLLGVVALQRSGGRRQDVLQEHQAIVDALAAGGRAGAEAAITRHLDTTSDVLSNS